MVVDPQRKVEIYLDKLDGLPPAIKEKARHALTDVIVHNKSPKEIFKISEEDEMELYEYGHRLFQSGKYRQSLGIFAFLNDLDPYNITYVYPMSICQHHLKKYAEAATNYVICTQLDLGNPVYYFYLADCYNNLKQIIPAMYAFEMTSQLAANEPSLKPLKDKADIEKAALYKSYNESLEK